LFILLLRLNYIYFRPGPVLTIRGAYHSAMAAIVFRKTKGHEDTESVLRHLVQFYKLLSDHSARSIAYQKTAELEMAWWLVDRTTAMVDWDASQWLLEAAYKNLHEVGAGH
jgi:hypothetical protein